MRIRYGAFDTNVDIVDFKPNFESGIEWKCVGGVWRALDRGVATDKYSTSVTFEDEYSKVHILRDSMLLACRRGDTIRIDCEEAEKIFGHEFRTDLSYYCIVSSEEQVFVSTTPLGDKIGSWSVTLFPTNAMSTCLLPYSPLTFPASLQVVTSVNRTTAPVSVDQSSYTGYSQTGFDSEEPTVTLRWRGTSLEIALAKIYLVSRRGASFTLDATGQIYYFTYNSNSLTVHFADMTDHGSVNQSSSEAELDVVYLIAG